MSRHTLATILLTSLLSCMAGILNAQTAYPKGCYMSLEELQAKTPSDTTAGSITLWDKREDTTGGVNDYRIEAVDLNIKTKFFRSKVYAYSDGTDLFLNCKKFKHQQWYAKVHDEGRLLLAYTAASDADLTGAQLLGGIIATAVVQAKGALVLVDTKTGNVFKCSKSTIEPLLGAQADLLAEYQALKKSEAKDLVVINGLLERLNERVTK